MAIRKISRKSAARRAFDAGPYRIESFVTVDDRGQMVLPKDVRDRAGLRAGDKLAVITCETDGRVSCITLVRADVFGGLAKGVLGPLLKGLGAR